MTIWECDNHPSGVSCTAMVGYCRMTVVGGMMHSSLGRCMESAKKSFRHVVCSFVKAYDSDSGAERTWNQIHAFVNTA